MRLRTSLLVALALFLTGQIFAQQAGELSRDEKRRWQQVAKDYQKSPEQLKSLTEERDRLRREAQQLRDQLATLQSNQNQAQSRTAQLEQENQQLRDQLSSATDATRRLAQEKAQLEKTVQQTAARTPETGTPSTFMPGVIYRVQVGAFRKNQIPPAFSNQSDMTVEESGGMMKVMLGNYRTYDEAKARVAELKRQGVKSPWVVPFKDGRRVSLKEAGN